MQKINDYRIINKIYESNNSIVYHVYKQNAEIQYILKLLATEYPSQPQLLAYHNEYKILQQINSDNVIKAYELGKFEGKYFIVLEDIKGLSLKEHNDYTAYVDINTVHQILDNIISNAVKYSPLEKQVYIRILDQEQNIRCEIQDEGYGLSQEDQAKLFGKFTRLSTKPTGGEHSTGLGLFIAAKLIDAMNGKVWCESELGHGATFIIIFPKYSNKTNC